MKFSEDRQNLIFPPLLSAIKPTQISPKQELKKNKSRLIELKEQMKFMNDNIKKFADILKKEVGEQTDIKELLRQGGSSGWQNRAQTIMNLRLKLISMRSKFLEPPHKMYYRGPFDPKKEFELKCLPQKQDNLYGKMLVEKKKEILQSDKPVASLKKELDELSLRYRAACFRTKNLTRKVRYTGKELEKSKEKTAFNLRAIEAMMAHQSLFKMMIEPENFHLDTELKRHAKHVLLSAEAESEWKKYRMSLDETQKQTNSLREALFPITAKLDEVSKKISESKKVDIETRLRFTAQSNSEMNKKDKGNKDKAKEELNVENEYKLLIQENQRLRHFLVSFIITGEKDFKLFIGAIDCIKQEFLNTIKDMKCMKKNLNKVDQM